MSELKFESLLPEQVPVTIGDKVYTLTAPSSAVSNRFRERMAKASRVVNKKMTIADPAGVVTANMDLVSKCLRDPEGKNVPAEEFKEWPSAIVEAVLTKTIEMCGFKEGEDEDDLKNG